MTKIKFIKLTPTQLHRMRTGTHIHLMSALQDLFSAYQTENKRYQKLLAQFTEAIRHEDSFIGKPKGSSFTQDLYKADQIRRHLFSALQAHVKAYAQLPDLEEYEAAKHLMPLLNSRKFNFKSKIGLRQGTFSILFSALNNEEGRAAIHALQLDRLYTQLLQYHEEVQRNIVARSNDLKEQVAGAVQTARQTCNECCFQMFDYIETLCNYTEQPELIELVETCNIEIRRSLSEMKGRDHEEDDTEGNDNAQTATL